MHAIAIPVTLFAARTQFHWNRHACAVGIAELTRRTGRLSRIAGLPIRAEISTVAAVSIGHHRIAGRAPLFAVNVHRTLLAVLGIDRPGTTSTGCRQVGGGATGAVPGRHQACRATLFTDRNADDQQALALVGAARDLAIGAAGAGRGRLTCQTTGLAGRHIAFGAALRIRGAGRTVRICCRRRQRLALAVDDFANAARLPAAVAVNLAAIATEIAGANRGLSRRAA